MDDKVQNPYLNNDHAGTPENFKSLLSVGQREAVAIITPEVSAELARLDHVDRRT